MLIDLRESTWQKLPRRTPARTPQVTTNDLRTTLQAGQAAIARSQRLLGASTPTSTPTAPTGTPTAPTVRPLRESLERLNAANGLRDGDVDGRGQSDFEKLIARGERRYFP